MQYVLRGLFTLVFILAVPQAAQASVQDFIIDSFEADYYLSRDAQNVSQLRVQETIVAQFPDIDQNHGILRAIPKSYQGHSLELKVQSVTNLAGKAYQYDTYTQNDNLVLKIGDPNEYAHGLTSYVIAYTMRGVINITPDTQEFFWDINGDQWQQPFGKVEARVHLEDVPEVLTTDCFTGTLGSTQHKCVIDQQQKLVTVTSQPLAAGETLSIVLGFGKDTFAPYSPSAGEITKWVSMALLIGIPPLVALWLTLRNWRRYGRDPRGKGAIVPEYLTPKDVSIPLSCMVLKERIDTSAVTATILDMAVRHYVRIYEVKKKQFIGSTTGYELELIKAPADLQAEEKTVLQWFFGGDVIVGTRIKLEDLKTKLATKAAGFDSQLGQQAAAAGYFVRPPHKARLPYFLWGLVLFIAGFLGMPWTLGFIAAGLVLMIGSAAMPARTAKGVELRDYLLGLRMYMELAEADRLKALQSPRGRLTHKIQVSDKKQLVKLYEKLLPYAMLFGIEKQWIAEFEKLYTTPPSWYSSSSGFHAAAFASSLHGFTEASAATFTSSSSGSGGAGGGGGGGGGGGW